MLGRTYESQDCSIARALEIVGERWTLLVLRDVLFGLHRFDELQKSLGVAPNILTSRLKRLTDESLLERHRYQDAPERYEYRPTEKALALQPVLFHLAKWGDRYHTGRLGPPRLSLHRGCGGTVDERLVCERCGESVWFDEIETVPRGSARSARRDAAER